ncbi:ABC transporter permease [Allomesorhizobium alhagi]|uniref:Binding-protein-dependent transport systems inner membrane component n=1 Tax=Mesorhizobium alhagi CCNWXJ12-2 TaxID=1107882 RepID=H0HMU4_9HYPH|nr:ABC transporter permease [Mesorhizobium alhagi]EHK57966.1 binding-protein-dependent transport systems inner membrane component [Mesorhizobium alhagi CCNWXJ12-2]
MILQRLLARLLTMLITLFGVAVVVFVVIRVAPGDPIAMMLPPGASDDDILRLRTLYGLDKTLVEQFFIWLGGVARGDFGTSISLRQDVLSLVLNRLPATLELAIFALLMALAIGVPLAVLGARERGTAVEAGIDVANGAALSIPDFLWGLVLILLFGVLVPVFEISGRVSPRLELPFATQFYLFESIFRLRFDLMKDLLSHMFMPALALALPLAAIVSQLLKQSLKEILDLDYAVLARVKGFSETQVILRDALKNAALPTLTLVGVQFTFLIGGTVIVERLFSYEGLGNMAIDAVINRDLPLIQGIVLVFALLFVLVNLAVDITYALLNPRLRHG